MSIDVVDYTCQCIFIEVTYFFETWYILHVSYQHTILICDFCLSVCMSIQCVKTAVHIVKVLHSLLGLLF